MCYLCLKDDIFVTRKPQSEQRLRERAAYVKQLLAEADGKEDDMCYIGDETVKLLKSEQYALARML